MPRCIYQRMWRVIEDGHEIFAYVVNRCRGGDYYWVLAHITPSRSPKGEIVGYHSNRRVARADPLHEVIAPLYARLIEIERGHDDPDAGMSASDSALDDFLRDRRRTYDEFIWSL